VTRTPSSPVKKAQDSGSPIGRVKETEIATETSPAGKTTIKETYLRENRRRWDETITHHAQTRQKKTTTAVYIVRDIYMCICTCGRGHDGTGRKRETSVEDRLYLPKVIELFFLVGLPGFEA